MNALKLNVEWAESDAEEQSVPALLEAGRVANISHSTSLTRRLTKPANFRCPLCESIIYSRRNKLCGVCGRVLPAEFLFSPAVAERVGKMLQAERQRHKEWISRAFKEAVSVGYLTA